MAPIVVKKYGNRRLYDSGDSKYITLEELAAKIRAGADVRVVDAKTGDDLTQATLTQMILEGGSAARLLPVALLTQFIRLGDDALGEFFSRYVTSALDMYLQARRGVQNIGSFSGMGTMSPDTMGRMWMPGPFVQPPFAPGGYPERTDRADSREDVALVRRELEELKRAIQGDGQAAKPRKKRG